MNLLIKMISSIILLAILFGCGFNLTKKEINSIRSAKMISVIVNEKYFDEALFCDNVQAPSFPYFEVTKQLLEESGVDNIIYGYHPSADIVFYISIELESFSTPYMFDGKRYALCNSARMSGYIKILQKWQWKGNEHESKQLYRIIFYYESYPPAFVNVSFLSPPEPPFRKIFNNAYIGAIFDLICKIYGPKYIIQNGLQSANSDYRYQAAIVLGNSKAQSAIEPLISALQDSDELVRNMAEESLKEITGKNFGRRYVDWQKWWEKNKYEFSIKR